jgi:hypothetical protein
MQLKKRHKLGEYETEIQFGLVEKRFLEETSKNDVGDERRPIKMDA